MDTIGFDVKQIDKCVGDPEADADNPILKAEQEAQVCQKANDGEALSLTFLTSIVSERLLELNCYFGIAAFRLERTLVEM